MINLTKDDIVEVIKYQQKHISGQIKFTQDLTNTVYKVLYGIFVQGKKYVLLQAPTGSGKSIIGFVLSQCIGALREKQHLLEQEVIRNKKGAKPEEIEEALKTSDDNFKKEKDAYYLTSSKMLQDQIDKDIVRFGFENMVMLKGTQNYKCDYLIEQAMNMKTIDQTEREKRLTEANYKNRPCVGITGGMFEGTPYEKCINTCEYIIKRSEASGADVAIFNYHYAATVFNGVNYYFSKRFLTICDEAHKLSEVIDSLFTCILNVNYVDTADKIVKKLKQLRYEIDSNSVFWNNNEEAFSRLKDLFKFPYQSREYYTQFLSIYKSNVEQILDILESASNKILDEQKQAHEPVNQLLLTRINNLIDAYRTLKDTIEYYISVLDKRPNDVFFHIDKIHVDNQYYYLQIKDLNETHLLQEKFVSRCNAMLFMSATMGDLDEFATIYGLEPELCIKLTIPSRFDFSTSPIYMCNVGNLRRADFWTNINKCIDSVIDIITKLHPNEKGVVHTHTFQINEILHQAILKDPNLYARCLFYNNPIEKLQVIKTMMEDKDRPLVIIGPSLVEGLDLKYDKGRFNILIKTPYAPITDYVKAKMEYCSFWYERNAKENITQAIGRTNRCPDDRSTVYLIDSGFGRLIRNIDPIITSRLQAYDLRSAINQGRPKQMVGIDEIMEKKDEEKRRTQSYNNAMKVVDNMISDFEGDLPF